MRQAVSTSKECGSPRSCLDNERSWNWSVLVASGKGEGRLDRMQHDPRLDRLQQTILDV